MEQKPMTINEIVASPAWISFVKKLELIGSIVFFIGLLLKVFKLHGFGMLFTLGGSTLSVVYYFESFKRLQTTSKLVSFVFYRIHGWGLAFSWIFILFTLEHWPAPKTPFFFISLTALLVSLLFGINLKKRLNLPELNPIYFIRLLVSLGLIIYLSLNYLNPLV